MEKNQNTIVQEANKAPSHSETGSLVEASRIVREAITKYCKELEGYIKNEENDPILVEGETATGYYCQMMVDPKDVAEIILRYDYPVWHVIGEEAPDEIWEELGRKFGLSVVNSFDL